MLPPKIPKCQAYDNAVALLCFNFVYANFVHSMLQLYTYQGCNHNAIWDIIKSVTHIPQAPNWPLVDFDQTFWATTLGVPLTSHFQCQFASIAQCNLYDNHLAIKTPEVSNAVHKKFIKEEDLSYNVVFLHWIWQFIHGLFLSPLTFVLPKYVGGMGCICVNGTNTINDRDDSAPNSQILKPGTPSQLDENPAIANGTAFQWFLM